MQAKPTGKRDSLLRVVFLRLKPGERSLGSGCPSFPRLSFFSPNLDITHGPDNRASDNSGVFLDLPAFSFKTTSILEIPLPQDETVLRTVLVEGLTKARPKLSG